MTADYNGWTDAPEAEREGVDVYSSQELEREALSKVEDLQKFARRRPERYRATYGDLRPAA
jgi:hypothetical protein